MRATAAAVVGHDRRLLARVLLRVYHTADGRDVAARSALRKRVDVLPGDMTVELSPVPTFRTVWRGEAHDLTLTQRRGGPDPEMPPLARPLEGVPDAMWWIADGRSYLVLRRDQFWLELDTSLPPRELRRFADTLTVY